MCLFEGCDRPVFVKPLCRGHYEQVRKGKTLTPLWVRAIPSEAADCGHGTKADETSPGQCWDCHRAALRASGQGARADRLELLQRQRDEGVFDFDRLMSHVAEMLMMEFARHHDDPDGAVPRTASQRRYGRPEPERSRR